MARILTALTALALFCLASSTQAQVKLEHKLAEGQKTKSTVEIKSGQTLSIAGMDVVTNSEQTMTISSVNGKRDAQGRLPVQQKIDALKAEIEVAGQQLSFDSAKPDAPPPGTQIDVLLDIFKATAKSAWTVVYGEDNSVVAVEGRGKALEALPEELQAMTKKQYEPEYLVQQANDQLAQIPNKPVSKGDTWEVGTTVRIEAGQTLSFKTTYTYEGTVKGTAEQGGKLLHKISEKTTEVTYAMDADAPGPLKAKNSDLKIAASEGTTLFDNEAGQVVTSLSKVQITGTITFEVAGMELPAKLDLKLEQNSKNG